MYNKFLEYLLENDPEKVMSEFGTYIRRIINPLIRFSIPLTTKTKLKIIQRADMPKRPIIFAATHGFKEDIGDTLITINRQAYILIGSLSQIFHSFDGISAWAAGTILVDRMDKNSRIASKNKMIHAIHMGASIIIFPEGTWNKSPNQMTSGLFPGVYDIAKSTGALVAPVATHRDGKYVYSILGDAFDITAFNRNDGINVLRDKMATMRWSLLEKYSVCSRTDLPFGEKADEYWKQYIDSLMTEVEHYDYDVEMHTKFIDKSIISPKDAFEHLNHITPNSNTAFLFNKRLK